MVGSVQRDAPRLAVGVATLAFVALTIAAMGASGALAEDENPRRTGMVLRIGLPIDGQTVDRAEEFIRRARDRANEAKGRTVLVFEFVVPKDQADFGRGSKFGAALDLAKLISSDQLNGVRTVAYVPQSIQGHAVLPVLACDEIVMAPKTAIGPAGVDEQLVTETERSNYAEIANRRKTVPAPIAVWLLDPTRDVFVVETEVNREFVFADQLAELEKRHVVKSQRPLFNPDAPQESLAAERGQLTGDEARNLKLVSYLANSRDELAAALNLDPRDLNEDPSLVGGWNAVRVHLSGVMSAGLAARTQRTIEEQISLHGVNFVCLTIDSPGGSLADSVQLASYLGKLDAARVRVVAFVPQAARSDAALVALACHDLVMEPRAVIGGPGAEDFSRTEIAQVEPLIRDRTGPWRHRPWSLVAAMIDPSLTVFRCVRGDEVAYMSDAEIEELRAREPDAAPWAKKEPITIPGETLQLSAERARNLHLAYQVVDSFGEFRRLYRLEADPRLVTPGWVQEIIEMLASPSLAVVLLMLGFVALYIELHTPGIGLGAFLATVCFVLFFWSRFLGHTAAWLEICLFLAGLSCILMEIFVLPGFGIFGFGGGVLILASLVLASQTFVWPHNSYQFAQLQQSLVTVALAAGGCIAIAIALRQWLPRSPVYGAVVLQPPRGEEAETISRRESLVDLRDLAVGHQGVTTTTLLPGGKARFGDRFVDVVSDGELIERGRAVEVIKIQGHRIEVRAVDG